MTDIRAILVAAGDAEAVKAWDELVATLDAVDAAWLAWLYVPTDMSLLEELGAQMRRLLTARSNAGALAPKE